MAKRLKHRVGINGNVYETDLDGEPLRNIDVVENGHLFPPIERRGSSSIKDEQFILLLGGYDNLYNSGCINVPIINFPIGESGERGTFIDTPIIFSSTPSDKAISLNSYNRTASPASFESDALRISPASDKQTIESDTLQISPSEAHHMVFTRQSSISRYHDTLPVPQHFDSVGLLDDESNGFNSGLLLALPNEILSTRSLFSSMERGDETRMFSSPSSYSSNPPEIVIQGTDGQSRQTSLKAFNKQPIYQEWKRVDKQPSIPEIDEPKSIKVLIEPKEYMERVKSVSLSRIKDTPSASLEPPINLKPSPEIRGRGRSTSFGGLLKGRMDRTLGRENVEKIGDLSPNGIITNFPSSLISAPSNSRSRNRSKDAIKGRASSIVELSPGQRPGSLPELYEPPIQLPDIFVSEFENTVPPVLLFAKPHVEVTIPPEPESKSARLTSQLKRRTTIKSKPEKLNEIDESLGDLLNEDVPDPDAEDNEASLRRRRSTAVSGMEDENKRFSFSKWGLSLDRSGNAEGFEIGSPSSSSAAEKGQSKISSRHNSIKRKSRVPDMPIQVNRKSNIPDMPNIANRQSINTNPDFLNSENRMSKPPQIPKLYDKKPSELSVRIDSDDKRTSHISEISPSTAERRKSRRLRKLFSGVDDGDSTESFIMPEIVITPSEDPLPLNHDSPHAAEDLCNEDRMRKTSLPTGMISFL
jgi:hypothetical protein